ncbi:MAG: hypothetical protein WC525_10245 [Candidatus Thermoplasmatota archaeon]
MSRTTIGKRIRFLLKRTTLKRLANLYGNISMMFVAWLSIIVFFKGYFNPLHIVVINVNAFMEAGWEAPLMIASAPFMVYAMYHHVNDVVSIIRGDEKPDDAISLSTKPSGDPIANQESVANLVKRE